MSNNIIDLIDTPLIKSLSFETSLDCSHYINRYMENDLIIAHFNIRSINKNYDNLIAFMNHFSVKIDIIICSETRVIIDQNFFNITGFNLVYSGSNFNQNDGTLIYVRNYLSYNHKLIEIDKCTAIEIMISGTSIKGEFTIFAMYRPPSTDVDMFLESFADYLGNIRMSTSTFLIVGDLNIDLLSDNNTSTTYRNLLESEGFVSVINEPTHVVNNTHTIIDHIFIRRDICLDNTHGLIIQNSFTDHYPILINLPVNQLIDLSNLKENNEITPCKLDREQLVNSVSNDNWNLIFEGDNPQAITDKFIARINQHVFAATVLVNNHKTCVNKASKIRKPWINNFILNLINKKEKLYMKHRKNLKDTTLESEYKSFKNRLTNIIKRARDKYYAKLIMNSTNNPSKLWSNINAAVNNNTKKQTLINNLYDKDSNVTLSEDCEIADCLNKFYSEVGQKLASKFSVTDNNNNCKFVPDTCILLPTDEMEILDIINNLKPNNSKGPDGISTNVIKLCAPVIANKLAHLINLIFEKNVIPTSFKIEYITPVYKSGDKCDPQNYRPLSKTSTLAKIFEKCLVKRIEKFCIKHEILSVNQFAYKKNSSAEDAISFITSNIHDLLSINKKILVVALDLAKAFNSINHKFLLNKLEWYGLRGNIQKLLSDYLSNRIQYVKYNDTLSSSKTSLYGVPQGTILGPLLFNLYLNDLFYIETCGDIVAYADDTTVIYSDDSWKDVYYKASKDLGIVFNWFSKNWLTINFRKSCFIPIGAYLDSLPHYENILIKKSPDRDDNIAIERKDEMKLLGVVLDPHLKWKKHLKILSRKLNRVIYIIIKLKQIIKSKLLQTVYFALFQSLLIYGIISWGSAYNNVLSPVQRLQNKALKIIFSKNRLYSTIKLYNEINIPDIRNTFIVLSILKFANNHRTSRSYNINTRAVSWGALDLPKYKNDLSMRSAKYVGIYAHNMLCKKTNQTLNYTNYSRKTKKRLLFQWVTMEKLTEKLKI